MGVAISGIQLRPKVLPELIACAFDTEAESRAWARGVSRAFSEFTGKTETAVGTTGFDAERNVMVYQPEFWGGDRLMRMAQMLTPNRMITESISFPHADFVRYFFPPAVVTTQSEIERNAPPPPLVREMRAAVQIFDLLGLLVHPVPGIVATLSCVLDRPTRLTRPQRTLLTRVGLHFETAFRLRLTPPALRAVVSPEGKVLHAEGGEVRTGLVGRLERHRGNAEERLAVWTALVGGQCSLIEREARRGVPRHYLMLDNPPAARARRKLSPMEAAVVHDAARGMRGKTIAYSLGISPAAVSSALASAAPKLGFATPLQMLRAIRVLVTDPSWLETSKLSPAERAVLELLLEGGSNLDIAQKRGTSQRTVANQVASILKKTGADSRRALRLAQ